MSLQFDVIGFDADDTLWHSEDGFRSNEQRFVELLAPYAPTGIDVTAALTATERKNLADVRLRRQVVRRCRWSRPRSRSAAAAVPSTVIGRDGRDGCRTCWRNRCGCSTHVPEVLAEVGADHRLILITKGDLVHQTHKVTTQRPRAPLRARRDRAGEGPRDLRGGCCDASASSPTRF